MPKHDHVTTSSKVYQGWPISVRSIGLREKAKPLHELTENQIIFWGKEHQKSCDQLKEECDSFRNKSDIAAGRLSSPVIPGYQVTVDASKLGYAAIL